MNGYNVALFLAMIINALLLALFFYPMYTNARGINQRYKLFAVRDHLIRLRIQERFDHDPELYDIYIGYCNTLIVHTREFNLSNYLRALQRLTPASLKQIRRHRQRIEASPIEVIEAIDGFYFAVQSILIENSTMLKLLSSIRWARRAIDVLSSAPNYADSQRLLAVKEYQEVRKARDELRELRYAATSAA